MNAAARLGDSGRARGAAGYTGPQLHCDRWRDQLDLRTRHAAVIGTGAAVARVLPGIAAQARRVTVFQHEPVWILPAPPVPGRRLLRQLPDDLLGLLPSASARPLPGAAGSRSPSGPAVPGPSNALLAGILRLAASANLRVSVRDSWIRRQLTPDIATGVRLHGGYYRALNRPNCELVTWPIARLAPLGIRTVDGVEHRVDCIIYAEDRP
ncbi:hypothetical protein OHB26_05370 [Nocardia sp. NBC_01503]|uniref:hypothetical protein n=1 Tax=Nocardia sp. NBC_01503 TaxID=2975997 RepID=UPI002E7B9A05|nr:hypothetical protein [Nocardia sp. NBC_01503]WTL33664.1 hypothetical protein OHB26_05370 [Nocardia sp. NBC_01503]